jgi:hypothetical protein
MVKAPVKAAPAVGVAAAGGDWLPEHPEAEGALQVLRLNLELGLHAARLLHPVAPQQDAAHNSLELELKTFNKLTCQSNF